MTLGRRMKYRIVALSVGLAAMVAGMVWGLHRLRRDIGLAFEEYQEARLLERAEYRVAYGQILLSSESPRLGAVAKELTEALKMLEEFSAFQRTQAGGGAEHESDELAATVSAGRALRRVVSSLGDDGARAGVAGQQNRIAQLRESTKAALQSLNYATRLIDGAMVRMRRTADITLHSSIILVGALSIAIGAAAAVMSLWQYRNLIVPVRRLREGAHRLAGGRFNERIPITGDDEFAEVEREFNAMATELDNLYRNLEDKVRIKSRELVRSERLISVGFLAAGVAHEINNPLNIITGYAELVLARLGKANAEADPSGTEKALRIIRDEAFRCRDITAQLLSLTRTTKQHRQVVSVSRIADEVKSLVAGLRQFRERRLEVRCDGKDLSVSGSSGELKQVLLNLTVNALEAVEPGVGEVSIDGRCVNGWIELSVTDNGRGMTSETLEHVFEPFFTERKGSHGRGVGLGLSITHAIIETHGGQIRAESDGPSHGSRFVVRLPAVETNAS